MKKLMKNKKAQIGATTTWLVATIAIFLIMIIYIAVVLAMAGEEKFFKKFQRTEEDVMEIQPKTDLVSTRLLTGFLNMPIEHGEKMIVRDLLVNSHSDFFEKYIQLYDIRDKEEYKNFKKFYELSTNFLDSVYDGCYLLCIYFREEEYPEPQQILGKNCRYGGEDIYERRVDRYSCSSLQGLYKGEVKYAELISLSSNGKPIKIKLFSGDIGQVH